MSSRTVDGLTYVNADEFVLQAGAAPTLDSYGITRLRRSYRGPNDKAAAYLRTLEKTGPDSEYPELTLLSITPDADRSFTTFTLEYAGLLAGVEPAEQVEAVTTPETVQLRETTTGAILELDYMAASSTWKYATRAYPQVRRHPDSYFLSVENLTIQAKRGPSTGTFSYGIEIVSGPFQRTQVGSVWSNSESTTVRIVPDGTKTVSATEIFRHRFAPPVLTVQ